MATTSSSPVLLAVVLLATMAVLFSPALSAPVYGDEDALSSCPPLHDIVRSTVRAALRQETALAAGLLRIFFHDCFPNGCDASILLLRPRGGAAAETSLGPNLTIQRRAMQLIEDIRAEVHFACGPTFSCADITALATRAAVVASGGPSYALPKGQLDSFFPAPQEAVFQLPDPSTASVATLLRAFASRGLGDPGDLVALSGGHTIGRTRCRFFADRSARMEDTFSRKLAANCSKYPDRLQNLDVVTPDLFDNGFFKALTYNQGVFTSDMALVKDRTTKQATTGGLRTRHG
uniref:Uncharacterized protein n=1 Tax=Avena sativa TaxID=4498 RepID=A0ACD5YBV1_AVESA